MEKATEHAGLRVSSNSIAPLLTLARSVSALDGVVETAPGWNRDLSLQGYFRLVQRLSLRAGDETCRMSSRPLAVGTSDYMIDTVRGARDLEDAMRRVARAYNLIHGGDFNRVERRDGRLAYVVDDRAFPYASHVEMEASCTLVEGILIFIHAMFGLSVGRDLEPSLLRVRTRRPRRRGSDGLLGFWQAPVRCNVHAYALEYDDAVATLGVRPEGLSATDDVYDAIAVLVDGRGAGEAPGFLERVADALASGVRHQPAVARRLGVSVATLRRRLEAEGLSFRDLRARALDESARSLLAAGRDVAQVAELLGFADARSFSRAFKSRNGLTPAAFVAERERICPHKLTAAVIDGVPRTRL